MADDASPTVTPAAPAIPAAPVGETVHQAMQRHGLGIPGGTQETPPEYRGLGVTSPSEAEPEPTPAAEPAGQATTTAPATDQGEAKRRQLGELAKELGYELDAQRVTAKERHAFREAQRRHKEALASRERELLAEIGKTKAELEQDLAFARALRSAHQTRDPDGVAKALGAAGWKELQEDYYAAQIDPGYLRSKELEERTRRLERERQELQQQAEQQKQQAERHRIEVEYYTQLSTRMSASKDPVAAALATDPETLQDIYRVQQEHWDGTSTVTPEEALRLSLHGQPSAEARYRARHERYVRAFAAPPPNAPQPQGATAAETARSAPRTSVAAGPTTPHASGRRKLSPREADQEYYARMSRELKTAAAQEMADERRRRR